MLTKLLIFVLSVIVLVGGYFWLGNKKNQTSSPDISNQQVTDQTISDKEVPLPTEEDIVRLFFGLIDEHQIPEAIAMMSPGLVPSDTAKQEWGVHFNAIESIKVLKIEPSMEEAWGENKHTYRVSLEVVVSAKATSAPIPYYGWEDNPNFRWITLEKGSTDSWQITAIATGP